MKTEERTARFSELPKEFVDGLLEAGLVALNAQSQAEQSSTAGHGVEAADQKTKNNVIVLRPGVTIQDIE